MRNGVELRSGWHVMVLGRLGLFEGLPRELRDSGRAVSLLAFMLRDRANRDKVRANWMRIAPVDMPLRPYGDREIGAALAAALRSGQTEAMLLVDRSIVVAPALAAPVQKPARRAAPQQGSAAAPQASAAPHASAAPQAQRGPAGPVGQGAQAAAVEPVSRWPLERRLEAVLQRTRSKVPGEAAEALAALVSKESIATMLGLMTVGALANLTPYGWAADAAIVGVAFLFGGIAAVHALGDLVTCFDRTRNAHTEKDLDQASDALARAIIGLGVLVLIALLHRFAKNKGGAGEASEEAGAATRPQQTSAPRRRPSPARSSAAAEPAPRAEAKPAAKPKVDKPTGGKDDFDYYRYFWEGKKDTVSLKRQGQEVIVDYVKRVDNPKGSAGQMIAEAAKAAGVEKPPTITAPNVLQKAANSNEVIEAALKQAAEALGGKVSKIERGVDAGNHWIKVHVDYP